MTVEEAEGFVVAGTRVADIANNLVPTLNALADRYGRLEVLTAMAVLLRLEVGADNAKAVIDGVDEDAFSRVPPPGEVGAS